MSASAEQDYINNLSVAFINEDEIVLSVYVYHDHSIYTPIVDGDRIEILNYYLLWGADGYEDVDTVYEYEVADEVPEVTGPTLGLKGEGLAEVEIAVWGVRPVKKNVSDLILHSSLRYLKANICLIS